MTYTDSLLKPEQISFVWLQGIR